MSTILTTTSSNLSSLQGTASPGDTYFDSDSKQIVVWDGSAWSGYNSDGAFLNPITNNYSFSLDGTDDHAEVAGSSEIQISYPLTISAWIYPTADASHNNIRTIVGWGSAGQGQGRFFGVTSASNYLSFQTYQSIVTSSTALPINRWYHVAATVTNGETKLYIDGSLDTTGSNILSSPTYSKTHVGELYYSQTTASRHFAGNIDELALFNKVLSASEISQVYNNGNPFDLNSDAGNYSSSVNLKAWWRMGDGTETGSGLTINNMSVNNSGADHLTIVQGSMDNTNAA
jgi:hypothetical protein